ncbi:MAG: hypothetical protein ACOCU0_00965 [Bacillota bacterium]
MKKIMFVLVGLIVSSGLGVGLGEAVSPIYALSYPFSILADFLRWMSLQGALLNTIAFILYIAVGMIPLVFLLFQKRDVLNVGMLGLISLSLFVGVYFMINPHLLYESSERLLFMEGDEVHAIFDLAFAFIIYSLILIFVFLKTLHAEHDSMRYYLHGLFYGFIGLFTFFMGAGVIPQIIRSLIESRAAVVIVLNGLYLVYTAGLFILFMLMLFNGKAFIISLLDPSFSGDTWQASTKVFKWSKTLILTSLVAQVFLNGYQIVFARSLSEIHFTLDIPLFSLVVALMFLGMSHYTRNVLKMNDDHKMVI